MTTDTPEPRRESENTRELHPTLNIVINVSVTAIIVMKTEIALLIILLCIVPVERHLRSYLKRTKKCAKKNLKRHIMKQPACIRNGERLMFTTRSGEWTWTTFLLLSYVEIIIDRLPNFEILKSGVS